MIFEVIIENIGKNKQGIFYFNNNTWLKRSVKLYSLMVDKLVDLRDLSTKVPKTKKVYSIDSYAKTWESNVISSYCERGKRCYIVLEETIFHPQGGGQPSDTGFITGADFKFYVKKVLDVNGVIFHYGNIIDGNSTNISGKANLELDWNRRYKIMRSHTAGHIIDYAVNKITGSYVETVSAIHSDGLSQVVYKLPSFVDIDLKQLEITSNNIVKNCLPVKIVFVDRNNAEEVFREAPNIARLPLLDKYRIVVIEGVNSIPCSGTHVAKTCEVGKINLVDKKGTNEGIAILYTVEP